MTSANTGGNGSGSDSPPSNGSASGGSSGDPSTSPQHHTDLPPVRGEPTGIDPMTLARGVAVARIAVGAALLLAPRWVTQPWLRGTPAPDAVTAWRVAGSRDIALGVGTAMAVKHGSSGLRGWLEAGALADGLDVLSLLRDQSLQPAARTASLVPAAATAALGGYLARRLSSPMGH